jgi:hypothetical protein
MDDSTIANHYDILGVPVAASAEQIKSAFRKSALQFHPDTHDGPESAVQFRVIYNAYSILSDRTKRREYDAYIRTSSVFGGSEKPFHNPSQRRRFPQIAGSRTTLTTVLSHLNYVLWDIEDLIRKKPDWGIIIDGLSLRSYIERMLGFIDKWVLSTSGFPDYFFQARKMNTPGEPGIPYQGSDTGHRPFVNINDYFYNVRVRTDKLLNRAKLVDLLGLVRGTGIRIIDCLFEAHNLCAHYLGYLKNAFTGEVENIPQFRHSDPCFESSNMAGEERRGAL